MFRKGSVKKYPFLLLLSMVLTVLYYLDVWCLSQIYLGIAVPSSSLL